MTTVDDDTVIRRAEDGPTEAGVSRPLRKDAARNRQALVAAGREVFAERGLDASLDDVAHRAGLGVGTAYRHFANKRELAKAIFQVAVDEILTAAEQVRDLADPWEGIVAFIEAAAVAQTADRGLREVLMGVHDEQQMDQLHDRFTALVGDLLDRAKAAGTVRPDLEVSDIGMVVFMLCAAGDLGGEDYPELWRRYLPMLLDGLRSDTPLPVDALPEPVMRTAMARMKGATS